MGGACSASLPNLRYVPPSLTASSSRNSIMRHDAPNFSRLAYDASASSQTLMMRGDRSVAKAELPPDVGGVLEVRRAPSSLRTGTALVPAKLGHQ